MATASNAKKSAAKKPAAKKPAVKKAASKPAAAKKAVVKKAPAKKPAAAKAAPKKPAAKTAAKKTASKPAAAKKTATKRKPNAAFMKPLTPSTALAAVVGSQALPRTDVTKKVWDYIKKNKLQDAINRRMINADEKMKAILGKAQVSMFEMTKLISKHLS